MCMLVPGRELAVLGYDNLIPSSSNDCTKARDVCYKELKG